MFAEEEGCGYDELFVSEVPAYLECVLCRLVLRDPVAVVKCGHHFCASCFERLRAHSTRMNVELSCPIDRDTIKLTEVFQDVLLARIIKDLEVKCRNCENGCPWSGELRNLQIHDENCEFAIIKKTEELSIQEQFDSVLKDFSQRLNLCESELAEKEKEFDFINLNLHDMNIKLNQKVEEVDNLNKKVEENQIEIENVKEQTQQMQLKNKLIERRVAELEEQLLIKDKNKRC